MGKQIGNVINWRHDKMRTRGHQLRDYNQITVKHQFSVKLVSSLDSSGTILIFIVPPENNFRHTHICVLAPASLWNWEMGLVLNPFEFIGTEEKTLQCKDFYFVDLWLLCYLTLMGSSQQCEQNQNINVFHLGSFQRLCPLLSNKRQFESSTLWGPFQGQYPLRTLSTAHISNGSDSLVSRWC